MNILGQIGSKIVWAVIIIVLAIAGYIWAVNTLLKTPAVSPPPVASAPPEPPTAPSSTPSPSNSPAASAPSPTPSYSSAASPTSAASPESSPTTTPSTTPSAASPATTPIASASSPSLVTGNNSTPSTDNKPDSMPALATANQVTLKVPQKLEKGAVLKLFYNVDNNRDPDPSFYSPSKIANVAGLSLTNLNQNYFQEVSGYFLVEQTGTYNFAVTHPDNGYLDLNRLSTKVDGTTLTTTKGGRLDLDKGWHYISVFGNFNGDIINAKNINVSWAREGEALKPLQVWREAK